MTQNSTSQSQQQQINNIYHQIVPQNEDDNLPRVAGLDMDSKAPQISPALETLPFEIRRHVLSMVEIDSLKTLVQASPVYFHHYRLERKLLLCQSLESTLASVTADAYAVHKSSTMECPKERDGKGIDDFLTSYHLMRSQACSSPLHKLLSIEEVVTMIKFHCSIVQPLMRCFASEALTNLSKKTNGSQIEDTLSRTEETRLMRGFYRFQLCCNIYGLESAESIPYVRWSSISERILKDFLCIFDPWEAEEISCASYFCEEKCEQIFDEIKRGLDEENSGIDRPEITSSSRLIKYRGLELLYLVYPKIKDQDQLVVTRQLTLPVSPGGVLGDPHSVFEQHLQWHRHCVHPGERDHRQEHREPLTFQGDRRPNESSALPPLAWTIIWGGSYSNLFGEYIPDAFCEWGWVMWDADRLERMGALGVMIQEWEGEHPDDPGKDYW